MILATIPVLFAVAGVLMYALSTNGKLAEIGRTMFTCGLLVALLYLGHQGAVRLLP